MKTGLVITVGAPPMIDLLVAIVATAAYQHGLGGGHWLMRIDQLPQPAVLDHRRAA
jgi:hypothetical protein